MGAGRRAARLTGAVARASAAAAFVGGRARVDLAGQAAGFFGILSSRGAVAPTIPFQT
jgi:hypothetical protein